MRRLAKARAGPWWAHHDHASGCQFVFRRASRCSRLLRVPTPRAFPQISEFFLVRSGRASSGHADSVKVAPFCWPGGLISQLINVGIRHARIAANLFKTRSRTGRVGSQMSLRKLPPLIKSKIATGVVSRSPKRADPIYHLPEHRAWRDAVIEQAGHRCEAMDNGRRCTKAAPNHRLFADHIVEVSDGGARYNLANGQCLCGSHHTIKTNQAKVRRAAG